MHHQSEGRGVLRAWRSVGRHWWWLALGIALVASALLVARAPAVEADEVRVHTAQTVQALVDGGSTDPFSPAQAEPLDPATQSVQSYLRAHEVKQPPWKQALDRVWRFLGGR